MNYNKKRTVEQLANAFARHCGYGLATGVEVSDEIDEPRIKERLRPGHRKNTTGEYVPNAYLNNFGWKNTYYQHAVTVVVLPRSLVRKCINAGAWL